MPVLLGEGTRLFDEVPTEGLTIEKREVVEMGQRTGLKFGVVRRA